MSTAYVSPRPRVPLLGCLLVVAACNNPETGRPKDGSPPEPAADAAADLLEAGPADPGEAGIEVPTEAAPSAGTGGAGGTSLGTGGAGGSAGFGGGMDGSGASNDVGTGDSADEGGMPPDADEPAPEPAPEAADVLPDERMVDAGEAGAEAAAGPDQVAAGHLQLWLRADSGVSCVPFSGVNRVTQWADRSGKARDARAPAGKRGPLCGPSAGTINGRAVLTFPRTPLMVDEEHLEVDLGALAGKPFSIALVERRSTQPHFSSWIIGAKLPAPTALNCQPDDDEPQEFPNRGKALRLGYPMRAIFNASTWGPGCDLMAYVPMPAAKANVTVVVHTPETGFRIYFDGLAKDPLAPPAAPAVGLDRVEGLIGRGFEIEPAATREGRYLGDLAEIVVYDVALADAQRAALERHLQSYWDANSP